LLANFMVEVDRQRSTASSGKGRYSEASSQLKRLVDARLEGADAKPVNTKLKALKSEKERLASALTEASEDKPLLHPNLAAIYRAQVETLAAAFRDPDHGREAFETVRSLIEQVRIIPADGKATIKLRGELRGILVLAQGGKRCSGFLGDKALQEIVCGGSQPPLPNYYVSLQMPDRRSRQAARRMLRLRWTPLANGQMTGRRQELSLLQQDQMAG
jgi:hypothetical protein